MNIKLKFKNINDCNGFPKVKVTLGNQVLYMGLVKSEISVDIDNTENCYLDIEHYGKNPRTDCIVENGTIVKDKNFELDTIIIDNYDIEELKWQSAYVTEDEEVLEKCLFFGKNGVYHFKFSSPILKWILETRHQLNNNDPYWLQDYESYVSACSLLNN